MPAKQLENSPNKNTSPLVQVRLPETNPTKQLGTSSELLMQGICDAIEGIETSTSVWILHQSSAELIHFGEVRGSVVPNHLKTRRVFCCVLLERVEGVERVGGSLHSSAPNCLLVKKLSNLTKVNTCSILRQPVAQT